ncbi:MAG: transporter substrate-binding domain-containing protein [Lentisphaerota bacterium]
MRSRIMFSVVLLLLAFGCGKSANSPSQAAGKKNLKAAVCPTSPPNCFQKGEAYVGIDVEIFSAFCESRGYTFDMTAFDWAGMLGSVIARRVDAAFSGISITETRKQVMSFSEPYMVNVLVIAAIAGRNVQIATTADWKKYRLGFVRGMYFGDLIRNKYKDFYAYEDLKQYPSYNELLADLNNGNLDGVFMDSLVLADQKQKAIYSVDAVFKLEEDDRFGFAFPLNSPLCAEFDLFLKEQAALVKAIVDRHLNK